MEEAASSAHERDNPRSMLQDGSKLKWDAGATVAAGNEGFSATGTTNMNHYLTSGDTLADFPHLHPRVTTVYEAAGEYYCLAQLEQHILYRVQQTDGTLGPLLFVPAEAQVPVKLAVGTWKLSAENLEWYRRPPFLYPQEVFQAQVRGGQSGRFVMHTSARARDSAAALLLYPDGTGVFCDCYSQGYHQDAHCPNIYAVSSRKADADGWLEAWQTLVFTWDGTQHGLSTPADILTCDDAILQPLCEAVFVEQVWPQMLDPFASYAQFCDEPLHFLHGSREELEHLTRCICHLDANAFAGGWQQQRLSVRYYAATSRGTGGFHQDEPDYASAWHGEGHAFWFGRRSEALLHLVYAHNPFRGAQWGRIPGRHRRVDYQLVNDTILVEVAPPSPEERAAALRTLSDWLEDEVTAREKASLLDAAG